MRMDHLKYVFGVSSGNFLGSIVYRKGVDIDQVKAMGIQL